MSEFNSTLDNLDNGADAPGEKLEDHDNEIVTSSKEENNILTQEQLLNIVRQQQLAALLKKQGGDSKDHLFWNTQPVPKIEEEFVEENGVNGPIDAPKTVEEVRQEPYGMPAGFEWCSMNVNDDNQIEEIYKLLNENYVEDDDNMFRFDYSKPFLRWALTPPGYFSEWHVGVRNSKNGKLMALITATPADLRIYQDVQSLAEINFLCVHKKLRSKRLAPVLIKEITRRVNLTGRWQAVYTAGVVLPKPISKCRYYHRSLNPKKLIEVKFSRLAPRMTMARTLKLYRLPDVTGSLLRPMTSEDVPSVTKLLNTYLSKHKLAPVFSEDDVSHWLIPREGVIQSFVLTDDQGAATDLCSFYHLPSSVIGNPKHDRLKSAYSYYNVATSMPLQDLIRDSLIFARNLGSDVFNALDVMDNGTIFNELKFGMGDGNLQYYLYNWRCPSILPEEIGLVLL